MSTNFSQTICDPNNKRRYIIQLTSKNYPNIETKYILAYEWSKPKERKFLTDETTNTVIEGSFKKEDKHQQLQI